MLRLDSTLESHLISFGKSLTVGEGCGQSKEELRPAADVFSFSFKRFLGDKLAQNGNVIHPFIVNNGWKDVGKRG